MTESKALKLFSVSDLDTFHALYELKYKDHMPRHADRKQKGTRVPVLTRDEALGMFPIGTKLLRGEDGVYIPGVIQGYLRPWWRVRYEDRVWEDLNKTEVLRGIQYLRIHHQRSDVPESNDSASTPLLEQHGVPVVQYPENFKDICEGKLVNFKWTTGWYKAKVIRHMTPHKDGEEIFELAHEGDDGVRDTGLFKASYTTNRYGPTGSWYIIDTDES
jgi:hypothetical protein